MKVIAHVFTDFPDKFGIPRQSGLVPQLMGKIVFEPEYRQPEMLRGIEGFDYLWLIWQFSGVPEGKWTSLVRPPRYGGNKKMGVFATRSPFRPNPVGLSSVRLERVEWTTDQGPVLIISGVDMMNNTPVFDVKPYVPHVDSHPEAAGGFSSDYKDYALKVNCPEKLLAMVPADKREALMGVLAQDPRPGYQHDPDRIYGVSFASMNIRFRIEEDVVIVCSIETEGSC